VEKERRYAQIWVFVVIILSIFDRIGYKFVNYIMMQISPWFLKLILLVSYIKTISSILKVSPAITLHFALHCPLQFP
jgi:hypothetical protein